MTTPWSYQGFGGGGAKEKGLLFSGSGGALKYFRGTGEQAKSFLGFMEKGVGENIFRS